MATAPQQQPRAVSRISPALRTGIFFMVGHPLSGNQRAIRVQRAVCAVEAHQWDCGGPGAGVFDGTDD